MHACMHDNFVSCRFLLGIHALLMHVFFLTLKVQTSSLHDEELFPQLSSMIDNAWKWAAANGRLQKNEVNGAEYATLPVDSVRFKTNEAKSSLTVQASATFQDLLIMHVYKMTCICEKVFFLSCMIR